MKIGVVGGGTVGRATARCWLEHCDEVRVWDVIKNRRTHSRDEVYKCDIVFICVPGNAVEEIIRGVASFQPAALILKSTVPIGTTRRLAEKYDLPNFVHSPEFLTERCALTDVQIPARNIVGDPFPSQQYRDFFNEFYMQRFPGVPVLWMTSDESEAVKLFTNGFFATKIAYFNEVHALANKLSLDWESIRAGILSDGRIAHSHTQVPGPDGKFGFGGKCLPADLDTLIKHLVGEDLPDAIGSIPGAVCLAARYRNLALDRKKS